MFTCGYRKIWLNFSRNREIKHSTISLFDICKREISKVSHIEKTIQLLLIKYGKLKKR